MEDRLSLQKALRQLDRGACLVCGTIRSRRGNRGNHCRADTTTRDRRQTGHQEHPSSGPSTHRKPRSRFRPETRWMTAQPLSRVRDITVTESDAEIQGELDRASARAIGVSCRGTPQPGQRAKKERSMVISPQQSCAVIGAESFWTTANRASRGKEHMKPQTEERGKRACVPTARGSISAIKGPVGSAVAGTAAQRKLWTALIASSSEPEPAQATLYTRRTTKRTEPQQNRARIAPSQAPMSAPGPTGERQEHSDGIVAFAGAGRRRRMLRVFDSQVATEDLAEECRLLLNTHLMFLKKEEEPTTKMLDGGLIFHKGRLRRAGQHRAYPLARIQR